MSRKRQSLIFRIIVASLTVILLVFGIGEIHVTLLEHKKLLEINREKMQSVNDGITSALKHVMILDHSEEVGELIELLRGISGVEELHVIKSDGLEAFSETKTRVMVNNDPKLKESLEKEQVVEYMEGDKETEMMTYLSPIISEERCIRCHDPEKKVLGLLKISFSMAEVKSALRANVLRSILYHLLTLLISGLILYLLLNKIVKQPVGRILKTIKRIAGGDLSQRLRISSHNEIGEMASAFDLMTEQLEESQTQLQEYSSGLEKMVKERTSQLEEKVSDLDETRRAILNVLDDATTAKTVAEESERKTQIYSRKLSTLHGISRDLASSLNSQQVIDRCAEAANELIDADGTIIFLLDQNEKILRPVVAKVPYANAVMAMTLKLGEGLTGVVASTGDAKIVNRIDLTDKGKQIPGTPVEPESLMCAPLKIKDKTIGVVTVKRSGEREFVEEDLMFLENLSTISAVAIQNARLYESLKRSEKGYRSLIETAVDPIIVINESSHVMIWNKAAEDTFGFQEKEVLGNPIKVIYPSNVGFEKHKHAMEKFLREGKSEVIGKTHELKAKHKDGHLIDILLSLSARQTDEGWVFTGLIKDITETKEARREIDRLANFPQENPLPVVELNSNSKIIYVNPATEAILKQMKLAKKDYECILPTNYKDIARVCLETGDDIPAQEVTLDSTVLLWTGHCLDNLKLVHLYATDITELKKTEKELREAKERAEVSDRLKNVFLSTMSHEVRTPLNVLLGYSDVLATTVSEKLTEEEREFLTSIQESGERLKQLITDILDISHIEADQTVLNMQSWFADELVRSSVSGIKIAAKKKNLTVVEKYQAKGIQIRVDRLRLEQAVGNLLQNAVKFTQEGSISVRTGVNNKKYHVSITDTGIGIKEEFKPYLFTLFRQEQEGYRRSYEGAGLGLSISQRLVVAMGGRIEVESEREKGSTFTISLPVEKVSKKKVGRKKAEKVPPIPVAVEGEVTAQAPEAPPTQPPVTRRDEKTVLIVEDNPSNIKYIEFLVKRLKLKSLLAATGEQAIELVKHRDVDCMLIDISLAEGMSGVEFVKRIRKWKKFKDVPMIAVTAHAMKGQREEFLREGFDDYLAKPFTLNELKEILDRNLKTVKAKSKS